MMFWAKVARRAFYNLKFRRQRGIGNYIVDFYCPAYNLAIEIDGDSHAEELNIIYDNQRTQYLESLGYKVLRYNNADLVNNIDGVFEDLARRLNLL